MREQYLASISRKKGENPFKLPVLPNRTSPDTAFNRSLDIVEQITRIAQGLDITLTLVGSLSVALQLGNPYKGHDIDFLIDAGEVEAMVKTLRRNRYSVWDENYVHRTVRNLTGGNGRHHNLGASLDNGDGDNLPVWIGFFSTQKTEGKTTYSEFYALSRYKISTALIKLLKEPGLSRSIKKGISVFFANPLTVECCQCLVELLDYEGIDFWQIVNERTVNEVDIARRAQLSPDHEEEFLEVKMDQTYEVPPDEYVGNKRVLVRGVMIPAISLENTYLRMSRYFPHYLGSRQKYLKTAKVIEESGGICGTNLNKLASIYEDRRTNHTIVGVFKFQKDKTFDPVTLTGPKNNENLYDPVNYRALLLDGVHFRTT